MSPTQSLLVNPRQLRTVLPLTPPTVPVEGLGSLMHPGGCVASDGAGNHAGSRTFLLLTGSPLLCCAVPSRRCRERRPPPSPLPSFVPTRWPGGNGPGVVSAAYMGIMAHHFLAQRLGPST